MTLPAKKATTPFKTMDIKTALLSGVNRKRKISSSQVVCKDEPKNKKLSVENKDHENDVEILDEACGITITLQATELDSTLGDCKENKDMNSAKSETPLCESVEDKLGPSKPEVVKIPPKTSKSDSPKSPNLLSDNDVELVSDKSEDSNSELNNSVNVSFNTSVSSITGEDEGAKGSSSKVNSETSNKAEDKSKQNSAKEKLRKRKMTPAEAQKKSEEREKKQKETLLKKQEIENKKKEKLLEKERKERERVIRKEREDLERKERERIKQEKKEQEEKERKEKEEQKQKEKEEKAKIKQMQLEQKMEEKKKKEEMKLKREEELKKAEEEKLKAKIEKEQKEKEKQERAKAAFAKFFVKPQMNTTPSPAQVSEKGGAFLPFQVSDDMTLAPVVPLAAQQRFDKKQLDHSLEFQDFKELYLQILKYGSYKDVRLRKKLKKIVESEADVIVIDEKAKAELSLHPKLLQFSENVRPPYWGTWRKRSKNISPRNPFAQDEMFDYSVDSDDEWDEGGPGESLSDSENEDESEDDYEVDNEFFVPHGYLSDEEEKKEDDDDEEVNDPEKQKALLKLKLQEFEMERKKKTTELKPIILGCCFVNKSAFQDNGLQSFLESFCAEILSEAPIQTSFTVKNQTDNSNTGESPKSASSGSAKKKRLLQMPEEAFPHFIRLVHGNTKNKQILAEEFQKFWTEQSGENPETKQEKNEPPSNPETDPLKKNATDTSSSTLELSQSLLIRTIRNIATYGKPPDTTYSKHCWWVNESIREKYGLKDALPNQWKYVSQKNANVPKATSKVKSSSKKECLANN